MTSATPTATTTQVHRVYIKATPQAIWDAITQPEWTRRYGYGVESEFDLRPGGSFRSHWPEEVREEHGLPEVAVDGEVVEADPPRRLVQTWRLVMDPELAAEGFTRLTYDIEHGPGGVTKLTVTHELEGAPKVAAMVAGKSEAEGAGGGWAWVLSGLKTVLETGEALDR
jgi:uncharacterized protein YndB with AHSA1/START domain